LAANGAGGWDRAVVGAAIAESEETQEMSARTARTMLRELPYHEAERLLERLCPEETQEEGALLDWDQIRSLAREGVTFGAHTRHHVALTRVDEERARMEVSESLAELRRELGDIPSVLAYPYGMHDERTLEIARGEGCVLGFTCEDGLNRPGRTDPLRMCRTNITRRTTRLLFPLRMLPWFAHVDRWRHREEYARLRS
jgi:peptidoglycan/xylan/chitin deacetylase (PgdA/CDA1 family)